MSSYLSGLTIEIPQSEDDFAFIPSNSPRMSQIIAIWPADDVIAKVRTFNEYETALAWSLILQCGRTDIVRIWICQNMPIPSKVPTLELAIKYGITMIMELCSLNNLKLTLNDLNIAILKDEPEVLSCALRYFACDDDDVFAAYNTCCSWGSIKMLKILVDHYSQHYNVNSTDYMQKVQALHLAASGAAAKVKNKKNNW